MDNNLKGVFAPITTPFSENGDVDFEGLKQNMEFYAKSKIKGYLALGSNGENKSLTNEEKLEVLKVIVENKGEHQVVMAGCIFESTMETLKYAKLMVETGADYITLMAPSYFKKQMSDEVLYKYFTDVAENIEKPFLVYNAPQFCAGTTLSVGLIEKLAKHPNIVGVKDSSTGNIENYLFAARNELNIMAGSANFFLNALYLGATGGVISLANAFPDLTNELYELFEKKDYENAIKMNDRLLQLNKSVSGKGGVAAVKYAMDLAGLVGGNPRLPLFPLPETLKESIKKKLQEEKLI